MVSTTVSGTTKESQAQSGKIGKSGSHLEPCTVVLTVNVPLHATIVDIIAEIGNQPWGPGESDYGSDAFSPAPLNGYQGQSGEWHKGWARADLLEIGTTAVSQFVRVKFSTWKHDNSRKARLRVKYC